MDKEQIEVLLTHLASDGIAVIVCDLKTGQNIYHEYDPTERDEFYKDSGVLHKELQRAFENLKTHHDNSKG